MSTHRKDPLKQIRESLERITDEGLATRMPDGSYEMTAKGKEIFRKDISWLFGPPGAGGATIISTDLFESLFALVSSLLHHKVSPDYLITQYTEEVCGLEPEEVLRMRETMADLLFKMGVRQPKLDARLKAQREKLSPKQKNSPKREESQ